MAAWDVEITSAAQPPVAVAGGIGPRGGAGTQHETVAMWPTCSYRVTLTTRRSLTTGDSDDSDRTLEKTFCHICQSG